MLTKYTEQYDLTLTKDEMRSLALMLANYQREWDLLIGDEEVIDAIHEAYKGEIPKPPGESIQHV